VRRLVEKYRVHDVEGLLNIPSPDGLGFAGKSFYSEFLAANFVEAYKDELFGNEWRKPTDPALVFQGGAPFIQEICDSAEPEIATSPEH
jgi:hypothetical protein